MFVQFELFWWCVCVAGLFTSILYFSSLCYVLLRSSWMLCSTWAGRLWPSLLARCKRSFCFRYSVRALGLWQYGWYVVTRAWEISQAYEVVQGEVWRSCTIELDWYKNSDLGSEVGTDNSLNSTTLRLLESVALLTKSTGIWTPLILSIVVAVAPRLISYRKEPRDHIVQERPGRLYRTQTKLEIVSYMGFGVGEVRKEAMQSDVSAYEWSPIVTRSDFTHHTATLDCLFLLSPSSHPRSPVRYGSSVNLLYDTNWVSVSSRYDLVV